MPPPVPLRTTHHRPELRTDVGSSLDLLANAPGYSSAPPPSLPTTRFMLPWNPCSGELSRLYGSLPSHSTTTRRPQARWMLPASCRYRWGRSLPCSRPWAEKPCGLGHHEPSRPGASLSQAQCYSGVFLFTFRITQIHF
jgi:hypothetical protein